MSKIAGNKREEIAFTGKRIRHYSSLSFDTVLARLRARVGEMSLDNVVGQPGTREEFAAKIQERVGDSGFMLMAQVDHSPLDFEVRHQAPVASLDFRQSHDCDHHAPA